jgi:hypothetical protein
MELPPLRAWAREQGFQVARNGRISPVIRREYIKTFGQEPPPTAGPKHQCKQCGRGWDSFSEAHCTLCHQHFATVGYFDAHRPGKCLDLTAVLDGHGCPKYKIKATTWGPTLGGNDEMGYYDREDGQPL